MEPCTICYALIAGYQVLYYPERDHAARALYEGVVDILSYGRQQLQLSTALPNHVPNKRVYNLITANRVLYTINHELFLDQDLSNHRILYVDHDACCSSNRGVDNQVELCKAANIPGFPTWEIDGKLYPGEQTLEELEEIVGLDPFKG